MPERIVLGIDGGGTYTRAAACDLDGTILARVEAGGSNPQHTSDGEVNVQGAIRRVIERAGRRPQDVAALMAGLAGLDRPKDAEWAERYTALPGLTCSRVQVNDSVVAHSGALLGRPGIIAVSGTGSIVFGVTETGRQVRNYDFANYAATASRSLAYETLYRIVIGDHAPEDAALVEAVLRHWDATDIPALTRIASEFSTQERHARNYRAGDMAPLVTAAAEVGSPLARAVCDEMAVLLTRAIRLVGACFDMPVIPVALIGGVARSAYVSRAVERCLQQSPTVWYEVVEPALSSVCGALLMALKVAGVAVSDEVIDRMKECA